MNGSRKGAILIEKADGSAVVELLGPFGQIREQFIAIITGKRKVPPCRAAWLVDLETCKKFDPSAVQRAEAISEKIAERGGKKAYPTTPKPQTVAPASTQAKAAARKA